MVKSSFNSDIYFSNDSVVTKVLLETPFSKEIRILLKKEQHMRKHKAPAPITVHVLSGVISFNVNGEELILEEGNIIALDANIPHDLTGIKDSVVRLTLSKDK